MPLVPPSALDKGWSALEADGYVPDEFVLPVSGPRSCDAVRLLNQRKFLVLNFEEVRRLLPKRFDIHTLAERLRKRLQNGGESKGDWICIVHSEFEPAEAAARCAARQVELYVDKARRGELVPVLALSASPIASRRSPVAIVKDDKVLIAHSIMGRSMPKLHLRPFIVFLPFKPKEVEHAISIVE